MERSRVALVDAPPPPHKRPRGVRREHRRAPGSPCWGATLDHIPFVISRVRVFVEEKPYYESLIINIYLKKLSSRVCEGF